MLVLLRNSARDGRKGNKFAKRWLGPYKIKETTGKNVYRLFNPTTGHTLKKAINGCRYLQHTVFTFMFTFIHRLKRFFKKCIPKLIPNDVFQSESPDHDSIFKTPPAKKRRIIPFSNDVFQSGSSNHDSVFKTPPVKEPQIIPDSITPLPPPMPSLISMLPPPMPSPPCKRKLFSLSGDDDNLLVPCHGQNSEPDPEVYSVIINNSWS